MAVYIRGNPAGAGRRAAGFLHVLPSETRSPAATARGCDLANAIASTDNPLTARVIVNRVWARTSAAGSSRTPSNFGALGERPTHPELLDCLAVDFVENGWSMKWLHREIVLSADVPA